MRAPPSGAGTSSTLEKALLRLAWVWDAAFPLLAWPVPSSWAGSGDATGRLSPAWAVTGSSDASPSPTWTVTVAVRRAPWLSVTCRRTV